jgi:hypothetical protein
MVKQSSAALTTRADAWLCRLLPGFYHPPCLSDALIFQKALNDKLLPQSPMMSRLELAPGQLLARSESPVRPLQHLLRDPGRTEQPMGTRVTAADQTAHTGGARPEQAAPL